MRREFQHQEKTLSSVDMAGRAGDYVRRMVETESRGWGDQAEAQGRLEARYGLPFWSLERLRTGQAKTCETSLFFRIKAAFVDHCGQVAARLMHEADLAQAVHPDDDIRAIQDEIRTLQARLAAAKGQAKAARR